MTETSQSWKKELRALGILVGITILISWAIIYPNMPWQARTFDLPLHDTYLVIEYGFGMVWWFSLNAAVQIWGVAGFLKRRRGISFRNIVWLLFASTWVIKQWVDWQWWMVLVPNNGWTVYPPLSAIPVAGEPITATGFGPWATIFFWEQYVGLFLSLVVLLLAAFHLTPRQPSQTSRSARNGNP